MMVMEYDGTRYDGWQRLGKSSSGETIQSKLEEVLSKMVDAPVEVIGSGRTDAGVHAYNQVANVHLDTDMKCWEIKYYLSRYLPRDIGVKFVDDVPERFHSRLSAKEKTYEYRIAIGDVPCVFDRKYTYYCFDKLDLAAMKKASFYLLGRHDFKGFSAVKKTNKSTEREIYDIIFNQEERELKIEIRGNGFLHHMVRIIVGTLIEVGKGERTPESVKDVLDSKDRQMAGATAPAKGLFLKEVKYL